MAKGYLIASNPAFCATWVAVFNIGEHHP